MMAYMTSNTNSSAGTVTAAYDDRAFGDPLNFIDSPVNQDGSKSLALNSYVSVCYNGVCYNGGTGFNMNTYTGSSLSRSAGVCFGASSDACAGFELGQGLSWDRSGGFVGMTVYAEVYAAFAGGRSSYGYEQGFFGAEGRGMYAGISGYGLHAEVSQNGGTNWGFEEKAYYKMKNLGKDPETGKPRKYVGWHLSILGPWSDIFMYDHGNRNDNQKEVMGKDGKGISREQFEKLAKDNDLDYGKYPWIASLFHPSNTDKMWMEQKSVFRFLYGWFWIPSVEGLFFPGGDYASAPSYNYGHNWITHFFLDVVPYLIMD